MPSPALWTSLSRRMAQPQVVPAMDAMRHSRATTGRPLLPRVESTVRSVDLREDRVMTGQRRGTAALGIGYLVLTTTGLVLAPMLDLGASESAARHYAQTVDTNSFIAGAYLQLVAFVTLLVFVLRLSAQAHPVVGRLAAAGATFALACVGSAMAMSGGVVLHHTATASATAAVTLQ